MGIVFANSFNMSSNFERQCLQSSIWKCPLLCYCRGLCRLPRWVSCTFNHLKFWLRQLNRQTF